MFMVRETQGDRELEFWKALSEGIGCRLAPAPLPPPLTLINLSFAFQTKKYLNKRDTTGEGVQLKHPPITFYKLYKLYFNQIG